MCLFKLCCLLKTPLSRLLWQPVCAAVWEFVFAGEKKKREEEKTVGPLLMQPVRLFVRGSSVHTQSSLGLFRAASLLWAKPSAAELRTQTLCVLCGEPVPQEEMCFSELGDGKK